MTTVVLVTTIGLALYLLGRNSGLAKGRREGIVAMRKAVTTYEPPTKVGWQKVVEVDRQLRDQAEERMRGN